MKEKKNQKSNFRCRESIHICRPLRCLRRLAIEYVKNYIYTNTPCTALTLTHPYSGQIQASGRLQQVCGGIEERRAAIPGIAQNRAGSGNYIVMSLAIVILPTCTNCLY